MSRLEIPVKHTSMQLSLLTEAAEKTKKKMCYLRMEIEYNDFVFLMIPLEILRTFEKEIIGAGKKYMQLHCQEMTLF